MKGEEGEVCADKTPIASPAKMDTRVSAHKVNKIVMCVHRMFIYGCTCDTQEEEAEEEGVCVSRTPIASPPALDSKVSDCYT